MSKKNINRIKKYIYQSGVENVRTHIKLNEFDELLHIRMGCCIPFIEFNKSETLEIIDNY